jgi:hypothetical protein
MRARIAAALVGVLGIAAAACSAATAAPPEGARNVRYAYQPGDSLAYDVEQGMSMTMEGTGDPSLGGMLDAAMDMSATATIDYDVAEGPRPDTIELTITTTFMDGGATITQMGRTEAIPLGQFVDGMASTMVLLLDPNGALLSAAIDGQPLPTELLNGFEGFAGQTTSLPQHIGPEFPDEPIGVGSTWTTEQEVGAFGFSMEQRGEHTVVAEEVVAGRATWKIESVVTTGAAEVDLVDMLREMMEADAAAQGFDAEDMELSLSMFESLGVDMDMRLHESRTDMTVWFDPGAGIVVRAVIASEMSVDMTMRGIPQSSDMEMGMDMVMTQAMDLVE